MLSERQRQCLRGVLELKTAKQIAREIGISHHMVEHHLKGARDELGARGTRDAARMFASLNDSEEPHCGFSELSEADGLQLDLAGRIPEHDSSAFTLRDSAGESKGIVYEFSWIQTVLAILGVGLGLVTTLALLLAVAQGFAILAS